MPAGRPPKPTALKILHGNPGKRPLNPDEPKPNAKEPEKPAALTEEAAAYWDNLVPILLGMRVLTEADGIALGMICSDLAECDEIAAAIAKTGKLIKNDLSGAIKVNPLCGLEAELKRRISAGLSNFGMNPVARTKVQTTSASEPTSPWAALRQQA